MKQSNRMIYFLILNVIVSACTILAILWFWDPGNRPAFLKPGGNPSTGTQGTVVPGSTTPAAEDAPTAIKEYPKGLIKIENIIGAGSAASEVVMLKRQGDGEINLTNWKLQDSDGNVYKFPSLTLFKDGAVYLHSTAGVDSVIDLFWNQNESVWQTGETATLIDPLGNIQATFQIP